MGKYRNKQIVDRKVMLLYMMYACICTCIGASNICPHDRNGLMGAAAAARKSAWRKDIQEQEVLVVVVVVEEEEEEEDDDDDDDDADSDG